MKSYSQRGRKRYGKREHQLIVEKVLGKELKDTECVHHADLNIHNNDHANLVVCPNNAYHALLHQRTRAYQACGNANARKCQFCKNWDVPGINEMLAIWTPTARAQAYHRNCYNRYQREGRKRRNAA